MDVAEIYNQTLKHLPAAERLQLAALILSDIASRSLVDYSEEWTEEDLALTLERDGRFQPY